jgi:uncharacterized protein YkwD
MISRTLPSLLLIAYASAPAFGKSADAHDREVIAVPAVPDKSGKRPDLAKVAAAIVEQTNAFRKEQKQPPVTADKKLTAAAEYFAKFMAEKDLYGHTADDSRPADRAKKHEYEYCIVLENIAYAFNSEGYEADKLAVEFTTGWKVSPGHRKNMLDPDVTDIAVAVARSEKTGYYYAVQMFGRPKSAAVEFRIDNKTKESVEYAVGDKAFTLPAGYARTHTQCRPSEVTFKWPGDGVKPTTLKPAAGDKLAVTKSGEVTKEK